MHERFEGLVLYTRELGERRWTATLFSRENGKIRGLLKQPEREVRLLQPMSVVMGDRWRRLEEQLGTMSLDLISGLPPQIADNFLQLQTVNYLSELLDLSLPEEHAYPAFYDKTRRFVADLDRPGLWSRLGFYELELLVALGYGLSLEPSLAVPCPVGSPLTYVSPKSGRSVSAAVAVGYEEKLLPLPELFGGPHKQTVEEFENVFRLTGHFLTQAVHGRRLNAREQLLQAGNRSGFVG